MDAPKYVTETRFYRKYLRISYESGSFLRRIGALSVDAFVDDGRPLFSLSEEAIARHKEEIGRYRAGIRRAEENVLAYGR